MHVTGLTLVQLEVADSRASGGTRDERRNAVIPLGSRLHILLCVAAALVLHDARGHRGSRAAALPSTHGLTDGQAKLRGMKEGCREMMEARGRCGTAADSRTDTLQGRC